MTKWILVLLTGFVAAAAQPDANATKEVMAASEAWRQAMMKKDGPALEKLLHDDLAYGHTSGRNQTKAEAMQTTLHGRTTIEAIDFSEVTVRVYGTTALIRANVEMRHVGDGKTTTFHINALHVWLKGPDGWQMVARQALELKPPTVQ
jgi:ketosteroid isomerase-like protein